MPAVSRQAYAEIVAVSLHLIHKLRGERDGRGGREVLGLVWASEISKPMPRDTPPPMRPCQLGTKHSSA